MRFDTRDETMGIWCHLRRGSHERIAASLMSAPKVIREFRQEGGAVDLIRAIDHIIRATSNCLGQMIVAELSAKQPEDVTLRTENESTSLLKFLPENSVSTIVTAVLTDFEFIAYWNEMSSCSLDTLSGSYKGVEAIDPDLAGLIRMVSRMVGCCLGQALARQKLSVLSVAKPIDDSAWGAGPAAVSA